MAKPNNLAYDYSVYEPVRKQEPEKKIQVKKNTAAKTLSATRAFVTALAALFLLCAILYGKVETNKVYSETADYNKQLSVLTSDNARLQAHIESKTSIKNVEDYAQNVLGLKKLEKTQIEYIQLQKDNVIQVVNNDNQNVFVSIKNWFNGVLEYIGAR